MTEKTSLIPARLKSAVVGGHVTGAADIIDDAMSKTQDVINQEAAGDIEDIKELIPEEATAENKLADKAYVETEIGKETTRATTAEGVLQDNISAEETRAKGAESTLQDNIDAEETRAKAAESTLTTNLSNEVTRAQEAESTLQGNIDAEETRAKAAEEANATAIATEKTRAEGAEGTLTTNLASEVTRATGAEQTLQTNITAEETRATTAEGLLDGRLDDVEEVIPSAASSENQLADKSFVNSSISTATATFRGTSATGLTETEFLTWANTLTKDNNDYVFWNTADAAGTPQFKKYKYNGTAWVYEYTLNNSSFTADQWATINSLLTSAHKTKLDALPTNAELTTLFAGKQDVISDLATIRSGAALGATAYQKPSTGIPSTDMASAVQTSLGLADSAYQKPSGGIPDTDLSTGVQTSLGLADSAYQLPSSGIPDTDLSNAVQTSLGKADTAVQPADLATVATSGSYNDLDDKPTIPVVPTNVSAFTNDVGYLTQHQSLDNYYNKTQTDSLLGGKQDTLISGTNIKTINNNSILGSGNIDIQTGGTYTGGNGIDITNDEISVKAGSNLSFDANGNLNATDTTYSVMGGSGASHASGLVPDPGATAGTTKYLREDGTWQTPAGRNYTAGDGINITSDAIAVDDSVARLGDDDGQALIPDIYPAVFTGTCSTAASTVAKEASINAYELIRHGAVAITFTNGISVTNATLNISSKGAKALYYRGAALGADVVKAGDIVTMSYDGTNYVILSIESKPVYAQVGTSNYYSMTI